MEEQDISQQVLKYHQEHVSRMLTWVGVEEERAVYLCDYNNVVRDLANPPRTNGLLRGLQCSI